MSLLDRQLTTSDTCLESVMTDSGWPAPCGHQLDVGGDCPIHHYDQTLVEEITLPIEPHVNLRAFLHSSIPDFSLVLSRPFWRSR